ncbi:MAG: universal stress protein [Haloferacaceae archaeon]
MNLGPNRSSEDLLRHLLVPVATVEDARATARALAPYRLQRVTVLHVVEKGEGVPDKTPVEQSESIAEEAFEAFREAVPDADDHVAYRRDVVAGILDAAGELDASAIAFRPREGGRLLQLLSGDRSLRLVREANRPVITVPDEGEE